MIYLRRSNISLTANEAVISDAEPDAGRRISVTSNEIDDDVVEYILV
jgi:hypothetical protein